MVAGNASWGWWYDLVFFARLRVHAAATPDREAVCADGMSVSYAELVERAEAAARAVSALGIGPGSTVGLTIAEEVEHLVACLALLRVGAWQVTLATHDTDAERAGIAERVHVTHILTDRAGLTRATAIEVKWPPPASSASITAPEGGIFLRTSGTTGGMNIVPLSGAEFAVQAERNIEYAGGRLFRPASIEHNNSKRHRLYCAYMGGTNVLRPQGAFDVAAYCARHNVTTLDLALMQAADLAGTARQPLADTTVRVSGSAIPFSTRRLIEERLTRQLYVRYGSTESGTISFSSPGEHDEAESVGQVVPGLELQIVDDAGAEVAAGQSGHIRVRGEGIARGYFETPAQTAKRFRDGWFWPGDMGARRADGSLLVLGRADDMINLNGINIFPAEIERVLDQHPDVQAAAALPLSSPTHGQIPAAAVELRPGRNTSERELIAFAREHLALRAPRRILVVESLPRNAQGKVMRHEIANQFKVQRG